MTNDKFAALINVYLAITVSFLILMATSHLNQNKNYHNLLVNEIKIIRICISHSAI